MNNKEVDPTELTIEQQFEAEHIRSTELNVLIEALELIVPESLGLSDDGLQLYKKLMNQLSYQEFVYLPNKKGAPPVTVLGELMFFFWFTIVKN